MITLCVKNYCHGCKDFEPEVTQLYEHRTIYEQRVYCVWRDRCARVYNAAKDELKGEANDHSK